MEILPYFLELVMASVNCFTVILDYLFLPWCRPTACVTGKWAGRDNAALTELTSSHANCLKTRRLPPVGCTLCWAHFLNADFLDWSQRPNPSCKIVLRIKTFAMSKKDFDLSIFRQSRITGKAKIQHYEGTELRQEIWMKECKTFAIENKLNRPTI